MVPGSGTFASLPEAESARSSEIKGPFAGNLQSNQLYEHAHFIS